MVRGGVVIKIPVDWPYDCVCSKIATTKPTSATRLVALSANVDGDGISREESP